MFYYKPAATGKDNIQNGEKWLSPSFDHRVRQIKKHSRATRRPVSRPLTEQWPFVYCWRQIGTTTLTTPSPWHLGWGWRQIILVDVIRDASLYVHSTTRDNLCHLHQYYTSPCYLSTSQMLNGIQIKNLHIWYGKLSEGWENLVSDIKM